MSKYIDVENVFKKLDVCTEKHSDDEFNLKLINFVRNIIENEPIVDLKEVVYCKDCDHYNYEYEECDCNNSPFVHDYRYTKPDKDDYCSYGVRKDK